MYVLKQGKSQYVVVLRAVLAGVQLQLQLLAYIGVETILESQT